MKTTDSSFKEQILNAVEQSMIATDLEGKIIYWNRGAEKLYGWKKEEVMGRPIEEVLVPKVSLEEAKEIMAELKRGRSWTGNFYVRNKEGREFYAHITNSPLVNEDNELYGIIGLSFDDSPRKDLEEERDSLIKALRERVKELRCLENFFQLVEEKDSIDEIIKGLVEIIPSSWQFSEIVRARIKFRERTYVSGDFHESEWKQESEIRDAPEGSSLGKIEVFHLEERPFLREEQVLLSILAQKLGKTILHIEGADLLKEKERELNDLLREKEFLLREIHHRVKNNMNMVNSFLYLKGEMITDQDGKKALLESRNRILSLQQLYDHLFKFENYSSVHLGSYIVDLVQEIVQIYSTERITIYSDVEKIEVSVDNALPTGIIVNELVTNAMKYAFPDDQAGEIIIQLKAAGENRAVLKVKDSGKGLPPEFDPEEIEGFGLMMVRESTRQIGGTLSYESGSSGTEFSVEFSL